MEKPILFSGKMVRAVLDGRKTQTRRVIKPQPIDDDGDLIGPCEHTSTLVDKEGLFQPGPRYYGLSYDDGRIGWRCPFGQPGDELWVREAWTHASKYWDVKPSEIPACDNPAIWYRADAPQTPNWTRWRPSIFMPRWASRIQLKITDLRVERVQDISESDCEVEGLKLLQRGIRTEFQCLWDSINSSRGYGWDVNPWCWVVEFERIT